jgi:hypothetical protein
MRGLTGSLILNGASQIVPRCNVTHVFDIEINNADQHSLHAESQVMRGGATAHATGTCMVTDPLRGDSRALATWDRPEAQSGQQSFQPSNTRSAIDRPTEVIEL